MIRTVTLDPNSTDPPYPNDSWNQDALAKWLMLEARFSISEGYTTTNNPDGTITFRQERQAPAIRIFHSP